MSNIDIYYQNIQGLRTEINDFRLGLLSKKYDIVALSETWLNSSIYNPELFSNEYIIFRRDRDVNLTGMERGGGVLIVVKSSFVTRRFFELETDSENIWLKTKLSNNYSGLVYFAPTFLIRLIFINLEINV